MRKIIADEIDKVTAESMSIAENTLNIFKAIVIRFYTCFDLPDVSFKIKVSSLKIKVSSSKHGIDL